MKTKIIIISLLLFLSKNIFSQVWEENILPTNSSVFPWDLFFVNADLGYVLTVKNSTYDFYKTTNKGLNWGSGPISNFAPPAEHFCYKPSIYFINQNSGYLATVTTWYGNNSALWTYKTTNAGINWFLFSSKTDLPLEAGGQGNPKLIFINENTGYLSSKFNLYRTTDAGLNWTEILTTQQFQYGFLYDFEISKTNQNIIYVCGQAGNNPGSPLLYKGTIQGGSVTWETPVNITGTVDGLEHLDIVNNNGQEHLKLSGWDRVSEYDQTNLTLICGNIPTVNYVHDIKFFNLSTGIMYVEANSGFGVLRTDDGGHNWSWDDPEFFSTTKSFSKVFRVGDVIYATGSNDPEPGTHICLFFTRKIATNLRAFSDYSINTSNIYMTINGLNPPISIPGYSPLMRGGTEIVNVYQNPVNDNDLFYMWDNKNVNKLTNYYTDKNDIIANFKTKNISTTNAAISYISNSIRTSPPTRIIRDTSLSSSPGIIHRIYESMGGVFYSHSTNNGSNFSKEEIVNFRLDDLTDPSDNKNSFLNIKRSTVNSPVLDQERDVVACWERYNNSTNETEIRLSQRVQLTDLSGYEWKRYTQPVYPYTSIFTSFSSSQNFNSYPKVFVCAPNNLQEDWSVKYIFVPHLRLGTNGNDLWITARFGTQLLEYIVDYNVSDVSVAAPYNNGMGFYLHFAYKKNNNIIYKKEHIWYELSSFNHSTAEYDPNISSTGKYSITNTPDISLRNGLPVITYQAQNYVHKTVIFDEGGNSQDLLLNLYPIIVKVKNSTGNWITYEYKSNGTYTQENPNIEGSINANGFIVNFSRNNSSFYQFVKVDGYSGYFCSPGVFPGVDAKLTRGSYIGLFGEYSNPSLITLNTTNNGLYFTGNQSFSISNIPSAFDGFNNLDGVIEKNNIQYDFTLGPIIVKNIIHRMEDATPFNSIQNTVEFNENMVSAKFRLSNNDTLILGAQGYYIPNSITFSELKYHVNLINNSTGQIHRELFRDTINVRDTAEIEFLRGYVINSISNGSDSFYVQLLVDTANSNNDTCTIIGVYQDPGQDPNVIGDNIPRYKTKVFFENESPHNNIVNNIPKNFELSQNYPNPFNPTTTIKYALPKNEFVTIKIYDITGREIMRLEGEYKQAGYHSVNFNGGNLASGVYFYRIQVGEFTNVKRMLLIK